MNGTAPLVSSEPAGLALVFQEPLTSIARIRAKREVVSSLDTFRANIMASLRASKAEALRRGYSEEQASSALYAVVAFLDQTAMTSKNPVFQQWQGRPLQQDWFKGLVAGQTFFTNIEKLLQAADSKGTVDVLEVYQLCMLLGYSGKYGEDPDGGLKAIQRQVADSITRVRRDRPGWGDSGVSVNESVPPARDRWTWGLATAAAVTVVVAIILFLLFRASIRDSVKSLT